MSDSFLSFQIMLNVKYDHPVVGKILELHLELTKDEKEYCFFVLVGIRGNSAAESARDALIGSISDELIPPQT